MDSAKKLTRIAPLGLALLQAGFSAGLARAEGGKWLIRLKRERSIAGALSAAALESSRERLRTFRDAHLSRKKTWVLPRTEFVVAEELDAGDLEELREDPGVAYVERDVAWKIQSIHPEGDPAAWPSSFEQAPWLRDLMGFSENSPDPEVPPDAGAAHTIVAVVDTGARADHPYLASAMEANAQELNGRNGQDDDGNGFIDDVYGADATTHRGSGTETLSSHGTHVAGIIKTIRDHAFPEFPRAAQVTILPVRFIGDDGTGSTADAVVALEYALARGAKVVNASWGAKGNGAYSQALYDAFAKLYANDVFFSIAAGNADGMGANDNDAVPYFPANYNIPSLISVASVTPAYSSPQNRLVSLELSAFSNFGLKTVQVAAPGDYSDGRGGSPGILSSYSGFETGGNLYVKKQGTSMAAPVVAGIAAAMRAVNPNLTAYEVKNLIVQSARHYGSLGGIQSSGLVNAHDAIALAQATVSQGLRPALPPSAVREGAAATNDGTRSSGCGLVTPVKPGGPFGGNSLGFLSAIYGGWCLMRGRRRRRAPHGEA